MSMLGCKGNLTNDQQAKLRGIHMTTKSRPMKTLRDLQNRKYGTPPTIIGQRATRRPLHATPIEDSIFTPSTTTQEDAVAVAVIHDQDHVSSYINSNVFEVGEVVVFRGKVNLQKVIARHMKTVVYQDRRQRRGGGNRYQGIIACLR